MCQGPQKLRKIISIIMTVIITRWCVVVVSYDLTAGSGNPAYDPVLPWGLLKRLGLSPPSRARYRARSGRAASFEPRFFCPHCQSPTNRCSNHLRSLRNNIFYSMCVRPIFISELVDLYGSTLNGVWICFRFDQREGTCEKNTVKEATNFRTRAL